MSTMERVQASETVHAENHQFIDSPFYRVNFWEQGSPPRGWMLDAFVLSDVEDLTQVHQWIDENARGRRFELFVERQHEPVKPFATPRQSGLIRLLGRNPNTGESIRITAFSPS